MSDETTENSSLPGSRLRAQRERRGLTLAQAGSELHINQHLLAALEEDNYAALGAPIFVKGHLRNYARLLGLDPTELIAEYEAAQQPADPTLVAHRPDGPRMDEHHSQAWVGWLGWVFLLILGLLLAGWWYYQQEGGADFVISNMPEPVILPEKTDDSRQDLATQQAMQDSAAARENTEAAVLDPTTVPAPATTEPRDRSADAGTVADDTAGRGEGQEEPQSTATAIQEPPPSASTAVGAERGLTLEFTEESWVEIYDAEGRPILYDLLGPGTRREINARGELRVFLGNADGVQVQVGGKPFNLERYRRSDSTARFTVNVPESPGE